MSITCITLAGGRGSRLGRDKVSEVIGNQSLLQRVVSCLISFNGDIVIVKAEKQRLPPLDHIAGLRVAVDVYPDKGPLGGIYSGLLVSNSQYNLVVAADMPFLHPNLLQYQVREAVGYDITIPRLDNLVEPLHAVYSRDCLPAIKQLLNENDLSVTRLLKMVTVRYITAHEIDQFDPRHFSFFNINTDADLEKAKDLVKTGEIHDIC